MITAVALAALLLAVLFGRWWVRRRLPPLSKVRQDRLDQCVGPICRVASDKALQVSTASQPAVLLLRRARWPSFIPSPMAAAAASACCGAWLGLDSACSGMAGLGSHPPDVISSGSVLYTRDAVLL